ncbi:response regulator [Pseudoroseicyclus sp. H15]
MAANGTDMSQVRPIRVILLIEDNEGDAELIREFLSAADREDYLVHHAATMRGAIDMLGNLSPDAILLDLRLPDAVGVESVERLRNVTDNAPIIVLTGMEDDELALECINAGAQDYLGKSELRTRNLQRAIGYAVTRHRETELRVLRQTVAHYQALTADAPPAAAGRPAGSDAPLKERRPQEFEDQVIAYRRLLRDYYLRQHEKRPKPQAKMELLVKAIGDCGAGPRDIVALHLAALDTPKIEVSNESSRSLVIEGRLMALEMMGLLVDYYRSALQRGDGPAAG